MTNAKPIVVAGHICLDIIPRLGNVALTPDSLISPGKLTDIGPADLSTGGAVANTGVALFRLGVPVRLMGKVGSDTLGRATLDVLRQHHERLADGMIVSETDASSYTLVINLPGVDRSFLHYPGANHTFAAEDVTDEALAGAAWIHFGYPTLMRSMYERNGDELRRLFERARGEGVVTSLDMAYLDPSSPAGQVDWKGWLANVLPTVDFFLPSIDETLGLLGRSPLIAGADFSVELLREVADELFSLGATVVGLKLGDHGFYLRTRRRTAVPDYSPGCADDWRDVEVLAPCFQAEVVGTTGAGDSAIAGFLAAAHRGATPEEVATTAVAVGAASVEAADATSGVPAWNALQQRIAAGWPRR